MGLVLLLLAGCASKPAPQLMTPQSRLIYHDGSHAIWTTCDRGNRIYLTHDGSFQVVQNGCTNGEP